MSETGAHASRTLVLTLGFGARAALQAALFIGLARLLGPSDLGAFSAALAIMSILSYFAGLGSALLLVREAAATPALFASACGRAILVTLLSSIPLAAAGGLLALAILPGAAVVMVACVALAEVVLVPQLDVAMRACQARGRIAAMAAVSTAAVAARCAALGVMAIAGARAGAVAWSEAYLAATAFAFVAVGLYVARVLGPLAWNLAGAWEVVREGAFISVSTVALRAHAETDKPVMARSWNGHEVGIYTVGQRFAELTTIPVLAAVEAALPALMQSGRSGMGDALRRAAALARMPAVAALAASAVLVAGSGLIPWLLGAAYRSSAAVVVWFAPLPPLLCARHFLRGVLIGSGLASRVAAIEIGGAVMILAATLALIPPLGWRGAVVSRLAVEALMLLACLATLRSRGRAP